MCSRYTMKRKTKNTTRHEQFRGKIDNLITQPPLLVK
jgi:hypothetical protein